MESTLSNSEPLAAEAHSMSAHADTSHTPETTTTTTCCIVGGGPAGMVLATLLARQGVRVVLLEAHKDFDRKFRGDTLHPSVLELMDEIGLSEQLHALKHSKVYGPVFQSTRETFEPFNLKLLKTKFPYIMLVPQVDFLNLLRQEAEQYPGFELRMGANVGRLVQEDGRVSGVVYRDGKAFHEIRADLVIGADGRNSRLRHLIGFEPKATSPPMDVLWFNLPRLEGDPDTQGLSFLLGAGGVLVVFDRHDHWQAGYVFAKGKYQELKAAGIEKLKQSIVGLAPAFAEHVKHLESWRDCQLLSVESSCCPQWHEEGLLLIGDAAHVMSPVGGVGINYAIHDAVAAANLLTEPLKERRVNRDLLDQFQRSRARAVRAIQRIQTFAQKRLLAHVLGSDEPPKIPGILRWLLKFRLIRRIPASILGFGFGRTHVKYREPHPELDRS